MNSLLLLFLLIGLLQLKYLRASEQFAKMAYEADESSSQQAAQLQTEKNDPEKKLLTVNLSNMGILDGLVRQCRWWYWFCCFYFVR